MVYLFSKRFNILWIIVLLIFISPTSFADTSMSITRWIVDSTLSDNGDLFISEDITFDFEDKFNGVYRDIVINGTEGIENLEVYEMVQGIEVPYSLVGSAKKGDKAVFTQTEEKNTLKLMIFSPSKN